MQTRDWSELFVLGAVWGASFLFMRIAVPEFGPLALVEIRVAIAAVFLVVVLAWRGGLSGLKQSAGALALAGSLNSALPFTLFAFSTLYITAGAAAVVNASVPLFSAVVAYFWLRERLTGARALGLAVGFAGVLVLVWDKASLNGGHAGLALGAGLLASLSYAVAVTYTKRRLNKVPALVAATGSMIASSALLLPLAILYWPENSPSLLSWASVIALGVACTAFAFIYYFRLIARVGTKTTSVTYLIPMFGMLWGFIFLHEAVSLSMLIACVVILLGTALATGGVAFWQRRTRASAPV
jgi:drug/metabolite transporter (DMT)-like permease